MDLEWEPKGRKRNVKIPLNQRQMQAILQRWAATEREGDASKGERGVKFWGVKNVFCYSYVTNMITLRLFDHNN